MTTINREQLVKMVQHAVEDPDVPVALGAELVEVARTMDHFLLDGYHDSVAECGCVVGEWLHRKTGRWVTPLCAINEGLIDAKENDCLEWLGCTFDDRARSLVE